MNPEQLWAGKVNSLANKFLQKYEPHLAILTFIAYCIQILTEISLLPVLVVCLMILAIAYFFSVYTKSVEIFKIRLPDFINSLIEMVHQ